MKKLVVLVGAILCVALGLVACGGGGESGGDDSTLKVGLVLVGPISDAGWNQTAYEGVKATTDKLGAELSYSESTAASDYEKVMRDYAKDGCNVVIGHGYEFNDAAAAVAKEFPDVKFIVSSSDVSNGTNLSSVNIDYKQAGFLQGVFAAMMTKTKTVAAIGGQEIPPIANQINGMVDGAKYIDPSVKVLTAYTGDYDDINKLKEQALSMIGQGSDITMSDANNAGRGAYEAARETGTWAMASIAHDFENYTESLIASGDCYMGDAIGLLIEKAADGSLEPKNYVMGVAEGIVALVYNPALEDKIPQEVKDKVKEVEKGLIDGSIVPNVPVIK